MEDSYITGEPDERSEASLIIDFEYNPDYDSVSLEQDDPLAITISKTLIYVSFDQINMNEGTFSQV